VHPDGALLLLPEAQAGVRGRPADDDGRRSRGTAAGGGDMELPLAAHQHQLAVAVLPTCAAPVLAELQKLEEAMGSPRKGGVKAI